MTQRIRRALVAALLVAGGIVTMPAAAAQAAGVSFTVVYGPTLDVLLRVSGCYVSVGATKGGTLIASGQSTAKPPQTAPNVMEAWDFVRGGAPVQLQISATTGQVITYAVPDRAAGAPGGHFARNIGYPIYRWRIVADNQVSGWVVPATNLTPTGETCF